MRWIAIVVLISASAVAQKPKPAKLYAPPVASVPATSSSSSTAAQLARIEQQSAHLRSAKPVTHATPSVKAAPALDMGKNKHVYASRSPLPTGRH